MKGSNYLKSMTRNLGITDAVNELTDQTTKDIEGMVYEKFMSKIVISGVTGYIGDDQMAQFILKHFEKYINPRHVLNEVGQYSFGYSNKHGEKSLTYCTGIFHIHSKKYGHHLVKYKYEQIGRFDRVEYFGNSDLLLEFDVKNGVYGYQTNGFVLNIFGPNHAKIRKMILKTLVKELKSKYTVINTPKMDKKALNNLNDAKTSFNNDEPIDIIEIDLKSVFENLGNITGENYSEELLDELFANFCVGK